MSGTGLPPLLPARRPLFESPRRPLLLLVGAFLLGSLLGFIVPIPFDFLLLCLALLLALSVISFRSYDFRSHATYMVVLLVGLLHASQIEEPHNPYRLNQIMEHPTESMTVLGDVIGEPSGGTQEGVDANVRFTFQIHKVWRGVLPQPAFARVDAQWSRPPGAKDRALAYGQRWRFHVRITDHSKLPPSWPTPHKYRMVVTGLEAEPLSGFYGSRLLARCLALRQRCAENLSLGISDYPEHVGLLKALLLGYREDLPEPREEIFVRTGTLHVFAISGLHVGILCTIVILMVRALGISRRYWILILAPILLVYTVTTGLKASAVRACIMALAYWSSAWFFRKPDTPSALAKAALCIVAVAPSQLLAPGFIFSFTVVCTILLLFRKLYPTISRLGAHHPWSPATMEPMQRGWHKMRQYILALVAMSIAAWIGSMPLTAMYFNLCSPIALFANLVVIPGTFAVVFTGCLSLLSACLSPWLCEVFNCANVVLVSLLLEWLELLQKVPGAYNAVQSPPFGWTVAWYVLLLVVAFSEKSRRVRGSVLGLAALFALLWSGGFVRTPRVVHIDGAGSVSVVVHDQHSSMVLCGNLHSATVPQLSRSLRKIGIMHVQQLVLSSIHDQTPAALSNLCTSMKVEQVWLPSSILHDPSLTQHMLTCLPQLGSEVRLIKQGDHGILRGGAEWEVLYPPFKGTKIYDHPIGLIMRLGVGKEACLFMGVGGPQLEAVVEPLASKLPSHTIVCGFQSDDDAFSTRWLNTVNCTQVVVSRAGMNTPGGRFEKLIDELDEIGVIIVYTDPQQLTYLNKK